jgi:hypothetical protein
MQYNRMNLSPCTNVGHTGNEFYLKMALAVGLRLAQKELFKLQNASLLGLPADCIYTNRDHQWSSLLQRV